jgi:hypothetical protein
MSIYSYQLNPVLINTGNINNKQRTILINWLLEVSNVFDFRNTSFYLGVTLIDLYLDKKEVNVNTLQCVGSACFYISSTMEETTPAPMSDWITMMSDTFTLNEFISCVQDIMNTFNCRIFYDTCYDILFQKSSTYFNFANYLLDILIINRSYALFELNDLADILLNFSELLNNSKLESQVKTNHKYAFIYDQLISFKRAPHKIIDEKHKSVSKITIPIIEHISENVSLVPININRKYISTFDISEAKEIGKIGEGTYAVVNKYILQNGNRIAVKHIKDNSPELPAEFIRELNALMICDHINIISSFGYNLNNRYIVLEFMDNNLDNHMSIKSYSKENKRNYIKQVLDAVNYIHSINMIHRDISTKNFLIKDDVIKLCDFGMTRKINHDGSSYSHDVCSPYFMPLEFIVNKYDRPYTYDIDIWSTGCVIGYILQEEYLFKGEFVHDIIASMYKILDKPKSSKLSKKVNLLYDNIHYKYKGCPKLEKEFPIETQLMLKMLKYKSSARISMKDAIKFWEEKYPQEDI